MKPKPTNTGDLTVLLTFPNSATGEAVIADLAQRLRDSESALAAHKRLHGDAALQGVDMFTNHLVEAEAFERASARLSVALKRARERLSEVQRTERQQSGAKARAAALALAQEAGALLRELLDQAIEIGAKLKNWKARQEEVGRLNEVASAGDADPVAMIELHDDEESIAAVAAEAAQELGTFLKERGYEAYVRKLRARRAAEAEAKKKAEAPTEGEAKALRAAGFDPACLEQEPRDADDHFRHGLARQELFAMRRQANESERIRRIAEAEEKNLAKAPPRVGGYDLAPASRV